MVRLLSITITLLILFSHSSHAGPKLIAKIRIASQTMDVYINGSRHYSWRVSTGRGRYRTPRGVYRPTFLKRRHFSSKYNNSPMPYSVFFYRGYAIHGTYYIKSLGRPASHGCIRLHPSNAARLYSMVRRYGKSNTRIVITR